MFAQNRFFYYEHNLLLCRGHSDKITLTLFLINVCNGWVLQFILRILCEALSSLCYPIGWRINRVSVIVNICSSNLHNAHKRLMWKMFEFGREVANLTERKNPLTPFLAGNNYPDSPHLGGGGVMQFDTQISPLLNSQTITMSFFPHLTTWVSRINDKKVLF